MSPGSRLRAACGLLGPLAFTAAWIAATQRQAEYSIAHEHISGLAAPDADAPHLMTMGFVALGVATVAFASELESRLDEQGRGPGPGPALMASSGIALVGAAVFRRDRRSNYPPPGEGHVPPSWRNDLHDLAAVAAGGLGLGSLLALADRFRGDHRWDGLTRPALVAAGTSAGLSGWFVRDVVRPGNGIVQRVSVSIPLWFMGRVAVRMLRQR